jgi:phosphatidate cytidylyltransferase
LNDFFRRTLTGAFIVIFVMGGFWLHPVSFFLVGLVLLIGSQYEYLLLIRSTGIKPQMVTGLFFGIAAYSISTLIAAGLIPGNYFLFLIPVMILIIVAELYRKQDKPFDSLSHTLFSVIYTALPFSMFPFAAFSTTGLSSILPHQSVVFSPGIIIGFFLLVWANDTGAYLTGVTIGRHKLFKRISPKKTWEGFFGGVITAVIVAWIFSGWLGVVEKYEWIIIAILVSVAGTYGDLVESMLKRSLGVKDSGTIMPGHGGFLDRFDSVTLSFPLVYLFITLFG